MIISSPFSRENPRLRVLGFLLGAGFLLLLGALWRIQVLHGERYGSRDQAQSLRRIRIPSARGEILDRHGVVLANNRPSYDVVVYLDQMKGQSKQKDIVRVAAPHLTAVSRAMNLPVTLTAQDLRAHYAQRRPLPLTLWQNLSKEQVAAFEERLSGTSVAGVDLLATPVRQYPHGTLAAHLIGLVGYPEQKPEEELEHFYYYQPDRVGKKGVERACDEWLRGAPGGRTIRVNPGGMTVNEIGVRPAERGYRVTLALDAQWQRATEAALSRVSAPSGREARGAAVLLDPRSGAVLAMASLPTFDPNLFTPGGLAAPVTAVLTNPASPMLNRAIEATYAPGSTFKPVTLLAGLQSGAVNFTDQVVCRGSLQIGSWPRPFRCWNTRGHGAVNGLDAIVHSCDIWFYDRGIAAGLDAIARMARDFGLGQPTGLDIGGESSGLVPTAAWKRTRRHEAWRDGDTAQLAIGQSFLLTTPLQMAGVAAALANGGTCWKPYVVERIESPAGVVTHQTEPEIRSRLTVSPRNMDLVRRAMRDAIGLPDGTGHLAAVKGLEVAGKTGTAEVETPHGRINRAWFIGFAPFDQPQVALAVVIEEGNSGGHTAAPVAGEILAKMFGKTAPAGAARETYAD